MSAQRKQYADLIRHRELNALRRLMVGRHVPSASVRPTQPMIRNTASSADQTVLRIDELEAQMNQVILERVTTTQMPNGAFMHTQIQPTQIQPTQMGLPADEAEQAVIRQAAIHFANKQDQQVQQLLQSAIGPQSTQYDHVPTWLALFDFYRATHQPEPFEALALDFSVRFGRSTPTWVSIPALVPAAATKGHADWLAPHYLDVQAAQTLCGLLRQVAGTHQSIVLDWRELVDVEPNAWLELKLALHSLADQPVQCTLIGLASLEQTFTDGLADAMLARLALLRCLNQPTLFEALALDYCVAFEVSPPDWQASQCQLTLQDLGLAQVLDGAAANNELSQTPSSAAPLELMGEMSVLPACFERSTLAADAVSVRCDRLVRMSPVAIAQLRVWVQTQKSRGTQISFLGTHRLIAAYLLSQGIYEFAKVVIRKD